MCKYFIHMHSHQFRLFITIIFSILTNFCFAQLSDSFSDGDFTTNPAWTGDNAQFKVNTSFQLQLNASVAGESYLSTPNTLINDNEWQFWVKQSFSSSSNNNSRVYLVSDQADMKGALNGYFVQIGETLKNISLWKQSGTVITKIIDGTQAYTGNSVNQIRVKVLRDNSGEWELFTDPAGGNNFVQEGSVVDTTFKNTAFFGLVCIYTVSNIGKFYFDDFYVGPVQLDTVPPSLVSYKIISAIQMDLLFSEPLDQSIAEDPLNYSVNQSVGNPVSAFRDFQNAGLLHLTFANPFPESINCVLTIMMQKDLAGNTVNNLQIPFSYYLPKAFDIVINEIMADPDPVVGLPAYEWVELYNRSPFAIDLSGWKFYYGSSERIIGDVLMQANSYLLLAASNSLPALTSFGPAYGFSSFSISNAGQSLQLKNTANQLIHSVNFNDTWYKSSYKKNGGWTLEMIDFRNPCADEANWIASVDISGGTPARANSVLSSKPDLFPPEIWHISMKDEFSVEVFFTEPMDSARIKNINSYLVNPGNRKPVFATASSPEYKSVSLFFANRFDEDIIYTLGLTDTLKDCVGNVVPMGSGGRFGIPSIPDSAAVIINEVLFNPNDNGADFVELYNRSNKIINLGDMVIASWDSQLNDFKDIKDISTSGYLLFPKEYVVLSVSGKKVRNQYITPNPKAFLDLASMPTYNNSDGIVVIALKNGNILDFFEYEESMHFALLKTFKGVSLERISFERPASEADNWHSASAAVGYASPAYLNSQSQLDKGPEGSLSSEPEIFSPDNDGRDDVLLIHYRMDKAGYAGSLSIYDQTGKRVRLLKNNDLLGITGTYTWDGLDEMRRKLPIGIYIIHLEIFDLSGNKKSFKTTTVLGGKL